MKTSGFKKGEHLQYGTSPRVYRVLRDETPTGRVTVQDIESGRTVVFHSIRNDLTITEAPKDGTK